MTKRIHWFPSNGSEGMWMQERFCANCSKDRDMSCPLLAQAAMGEKVEQWTAEDCTGRGFKCSEYEPHD